ncbi:MAG TPA: YabP/YqfC family sporulation protein [Clostridia bacterium]|jgi:sporulation protein YabP|nr:YabP/YqfC family sporulation protein [Clostridia bacterium]
MENIVKSPHSLKYENGRISVSGVVNLDSFENNEIVARLTDKSMVLKGEKLNVEDLNVKTGLMVITGEIHSLVYHRKLEKLSLVKRLFK